MTKENRFEGLMGVVGKNKNAQTSKRSDVQEVGTKKKSDSKSDVETSKNLSISTSDQPNIQTSETQEDNSHQNISTSKPRHDSDFKSESQAEDGAFAPSSAKQTGDAVRRVSAHSNTQASKKAKSVNPDYTRTTVYLPKKTHKKLKAIAFDEEREMSSIVEELVDTWLNSRK